MKKFILGAVMAAVAVPVVPAAALGYVEVGEPSRGRVGFGA